MAEENGIELDPHTQAQRDEIVFRVLRTEIDASGYGNFVKDDLLRGIAQKIVEALDNV